MAKKQQQIDVMEAIQYFFKLPDWKERTLWIGGGNALFTFLFTLASLFFIVPCIGFIIGSLMILVLFVCYIFYLLNISGYGYDVTKAVAKGNSVAEVEIPNKLDSARMNNALKLLVGRMVYMLPVILLYIIAWVLMIVPMFVLGGASDAEDASFLEISGIMGSMVLGYLPMIIAMPIQMIVMYLVVPATTAQYAKEETIASMLRIGDVWEFIKRNIVNLLINAAVMFALSMVVGMVSSIAYFTIFICIGFILLPVVMAVATVYMQHVMAHVEGQIIRLAK